MVGLLPEEPTVNYLPEMAESTDATASLARPRTSATRPRAALLSGPPRIAPTASGRAFASPHLREPETSARTPSTTSSIRHLLYRIPQDDVKKSLEGEPPAAAPFIWWLRPGGSPAGA